MKRYVMAITGASGSIIGLRVLETLIQHADVHLVISDAARPILQDEAGIPSGRDLRDEILNRLGKRAGLKRDEINSRLVLHDEDDLWAPVSSGSYRTDGMLIVPCSMKTLSAIANGYADSLITRAADVTLKEGRSLVISPRETPLNKIHLENMLRLSGMGVRIVPPVMGFYHKPAGIDDMIDFIAGRILDQIDVSHGLYERWQAKSGE
ncbi:putative aromatic acid decarboxylase [bacterium BMS3Bbin06]|nr:putative aromatic acid decarboxylase [bacterium BMS3Abin08]GBE35201.1 putative aromatic acid decarboxylase [bacterium BMS3Bbin06]HDO35414.1 UbiX family flavin prenyltransferase [Nitrospirota bacterium]HDY72175.1 UbiX family flavin prenyltransferase [Nitrospirota bacterium]